MTLEAADLIEQPGIDLVELDDVLTQLALLEARQARIVELKFFAGLSTAEIASLLEISARTVDNDWRHARAWLRERLSP